MTDRVSAYTFKANGIKYEAVLRGADGRVVEDVTKRVWKRQERNLKAIAKQYQKQLGNPGSKVSVTGDGARLNGRGSYGCTRQAGPVWTAVSPYLRSSDDDDDDRFSTDPSAAAATRRAVLDSDSDDGSRVVATGRRRRRRGSLDDAASSSDSNSDVDSRLAARRRRGAASRPVPAGDGAATPTDSDRDGSGSDSDVRVRRRAPMIPERPDQLPNPDELARTVALGDVGLDDDALAAALAATDGMEPPAVPSRPSPGAAAPTVEIRPVSSSTDSGAKWPTDLSDAASRVSRVVRRITTFNVLKRDDAPEVDLP